MAPFRRILLVSDNRFLVEKIHIILTPLTKEFSFSFYRSPGQEWDKGAIPLYLPVMDVIRDEDRIADSFDLVFSIHSKQIFPASLVRRIPCINVHPGFNPHNRGWFPQVFCINNGLPLGVTIHEMDEKIDHGPIIAREEVPVFPWDDSLSCYKRVLDKEVELFARHIADILHNRYATFVPTEPQSINFKADYLRLCRLDPDEPMTMGEAINRLRSLTHGTYKNAFFVDRDGAKIFVRISLEREE